MKLDKANSRDKKRNKRLYGMREDGRSVKLIVRIQVEKSQKGK